MLVFTISVISHILCYVYSRILLFNLYRVKSQGLVLHYSTFNRCNAMGETTTIGFKIWGELEKEFNAHLDEVEEQTGYRPDKSKVVRDALRQKFGIDGEETSGVQPEEGCA